MILCGDGLGQAKRLTVLWHHRALEDSDDFESGNCSASRRRRIGVRCGTAKSRRLRAGLVGGVAPRTSPLVRSNRWSMAQLLVLCVPSRCENLIMDYFGNSMGPVKRGLRDSGIEDVTHPQLHTFI